MFTLVVLYTLYTPILYILCTHVYPSKTVYPVYPYISCAPMFTLVVLYTLVYPLYIYPFNCIEKVGFLFMPV